METGRSYMEPYYGNEPVSWRADESSHHNINSFGTPFHRNSILLSNDYETYRSGADGLEYGYDTPNPYLPQDDYGNYRTGGYDYQRPTSRFDDYNNDKYYGRRNPSDGYTNYGTTENLITVIPPTTSVDDFNGYGQGQFDDYANYSDGPYGDRRPFNDYSYYNQTPMTHYSDRYPDTSRRNDYSDGYRSSSGYYPYGR